MSANTPDAVAGPPNRSSFPLGALMGRSRVVLIPPAYRLCRSHRNVRWVFRGGRPRGLPPLLCASRLLVRWRDPQRLFVPIPLGPRDVLFAGLLVLRQLGGALGPFFRVRK